MTLQIGGEVAMLLALKAKRDHRRVSEIAYEILSKGLWNEPGIMFKGKQYKIEPDLFLSNVPEEGDFEDYV